MGGEVYLAEYGRAKTIHFDLVEVDGVDLRVDGADGGSDCIVMTDEAAEGTATNDFVDEGTGYSLALTAAEMAGARITVYVVDSATKAWLDKTIQIETYGHPSSAHPFMTPYWANGAVNGGTPTTTVFAFDGFTEATADHVIGSELTFTSGANAGQCRTVTDYTSTVITCDPAFLAAPADNDEFVLRATAQTTLGITQAPSIGVILADLANGTDGLGALKTLIDTVNTDLSNGTDGLGALKTIIDAIQTVTDKFAFTVANQVDSNPYSWRGGTIPAQTVTGVPEIDMTHVTGSVSANGSGLSAIPWNSSWDAEVQSEAADALVAMFTDAATLVNLIWDEAMVETTGAPAITGSMRLFMSWWASLSRNKVTQTATTTTLRNDADAADLSVSTVSDDGTTFVRGEFGT